MLPFAWGCFPPPNISSPARPASLCKRSVLSESGRFGLGRCIRETWAYGQAPGEHKNCTRSGSYGNQSRVMIQVAAVCRLQRKLRERAIARAWVLLQRLADRRKHLVENERFVLTPSTAATSSMHPCLETGWLCVCNRGVRPDFAWFCWRNGCEAPTSALVLNGLSGRLPSVGGLVKPNRSALG